MSAENAGKILRNEFGQEIKIAKTYPEYVRLQLGYHDPNLARELARRVREANVLSMEGFEGSINMVWNRMVHTDGGRTIASWNGWPLNTPEAEQALWMQFAANVQAVGLIPVDASNDEIHAWVMRHNIEPIGGDDDGYYIYNIKDGTYLKDRGIPIRIQFDTELTSPGIIDIKVFESANTREKLILASSTYKGKAPTTWDIVVDALNYLAVNPLIPGGSSARILDIADMHEIIAGQSPLVDRYAELSELQPYNQFLEPSQRAADLVTPGSSKSTLESLIDPELPKWLAAIDDPVTQKLASELYDLQDEIKHFAGPGIMKPSITSYINDVYSKLLRDTFVYAFADKLRGDGVLSLDSSPITMNAIEELTTHIGQDVLNRFSFELGPEAANILMDKLRSKTDKIVNPLLRFTHWSEFQKLLNKDITVEELQESLDLNEERRGYSLDVEVPSTTDVTRSQIRSDLQRKLEEEATRPRTHAEIVFGTDFNIENIKSYLRQLEPGQVKFIEGASAITSPEGTMQTIALLNDETLKGNSYSVSFENDSGNGRTIRIAKVIDGDTVLTQDGERIRFLGVDAPETAKKFRNQHAQPGANEAMALVITLLDGKTANIELSTDRKSYGRTLASLSVGGVSVEEALVGHGLARVLVLNGLGTEYGREEIQRLFYLEESAKRRGVGIHSASPIEVKHTNKDFFIGRHSQVAGSMIAKNENLKEFNDFVTKNKEISTLLISMTNEVPGYPGQVFLIPRFNNHTEQDEPIEAAIRRVLPSIKNGKLLPYKNEETAEAHRIQLNEALTKEKFTIIEYFTKHARREVPPNKINKLRKMTMHWSNNQLIHAFESFYRNNVFAFPTYRELDIYRINEENMPSKLPSPTEMILNK